MRLDCRLGCGKSSLSAHEWGPALLVVALGGGCKTGGGETSAPDTDASQQAVNSADVSSDTMAPGCDVDMGEVGVCVHTPARGWKKVMHMERPDPQLSADAAIELEESLASSARQMLESSIWAFGLSQPYRLYAYDGEDDYGLPDYCSDASVVLETLRGAVRDEPAGCTAELKESSQLGAVLQIYCRVQETDEGCADVYVGQVWADVQDRRPGSFRVKGVAWMRRLCDWSDEGVQSPSSIERLASESTRRMARFFAKCEQESE